MRKIAKLLVVLALVISITGLALTTDNTKAADNKRGTETYMTTLYEHCYDEQQFVGQARVEQMFVVDVEYNDDYNVVTLVDTQDNLWVYENIDLYVDEEVLVLLVDNNTDAIEDDTIVHFWLGLEQSKPRGKDQR